MFRAQVWMRNHRRHRTLLTLPTRLAKRRIPRIKRLHHNPSSLTSPPPSPHHDYSPRLHINSNLFTRRLHQNLYPLLPKAAFIPSSQYIPQISILCQLLFHFFDYSFLVYCLAGIASYYGAKSENESGRCCACADTCCPCIFSEG